MHISLTPMKRLYRVNERNFSQRCIAGFVGGLPVNSSHVTSWRFNFTQCVTSWLHGSDESVNVTRKVSSQFARVCQLVASCLWLCDELTNTMWWLDLVTSWSCDELTIWRVDRVTSWSCDELTGSGSPWEGHFFYPFADKKSIVHTLLLKEGFFLVHI